MTDGYDPSSWVSVDGVRLDEVASGDVSFVEERVRALGEQGGGWFDIPLASGAFYRLRVTPSTSVVIRYAS